MSRSKHCENVISFGRILFGNKLGRDFKCTIHIGSTDAKPIDFEALPSAALFNGIEIISFLIV